MGESKRGYVVFKAGSQPAVCEIEKSNPAPEMNPEEPSTADNNAPGSLPDVPPSPDSKQEKKGQRTILDLAACRDVAMKQLGFKKAKVEEQLKEKAAEPAKLMELIKKFRKAAPCPSQWSNMQGADRVRLCKQCKLQVYDFSHLNDEEAKEFLAQRGETGKVTFYKRKDGKFLLSDCPVGAKARQVKISMVAAIISALVSILVFSLVNSASRPVETGIQSKPNEMTIDGSKLMPGSAVTGSESSSGESSPAHSQWKATKATDYWSRKTEDFWRDGAKRGEVDIGRDVASSPEVKSGK